MKSKNLFFIFILFSLVNVSAFNFESNGVRIIEPLTDYGDIPVSNRPFYFDVVLGRIEGASHLRKWGFNPSIDSGIDADIWDYGDTTGAEIYTYSPGFPGIGAGATANIDTLSSSSISDTQEITIVGLDIDGYEVIQTVVSDGQNRVTLNTSLWRVYRAWNSDTTDLIGDVYVYVNGTITAGVPDTVTDVRAQIKVGNGQTQMALYTIPKGKVGMFINIEFSVIKKTQAIALITPLIRGAGGVFRKAAVATMSTGGTSYQQEISPVPEFFPEFADLVVRADTSTIDVGVGTSFTVILLDKEIWGID